MAKPHKYAWNGLDVETSLTFEQLANMAQRAAQECTGDLLHGKHRIASVKSSDRQIEFRINDFLITFKKFMVFYLDFEVRDGRTWMSSRIAWYVTTQPTVGGFIPAGTKSMVGHHTYMQFAHHLADQVRAADPQARITLREGVASTTTPPSPSHPGAAAAPAAQPPAAQPSSPAQYAAQPAPMVAPRPPAGPLPPPPPAPGAVAQRGAYPPPPPSRGAAAGAFAPPPPPPAPPRAPAGAPVIPRTPDAGSGLVTSVPGMPQRDMPVQRSVEVQPSGFASLAEQLFAEDDDLFHTQMVQASAAALPWVLCLPDGRELALASALVLGRNPAAPAGTQAVPLALDDPNRSVSKTHALVELRTGLPWVTDLHSTNGTTLTNDIGEAVVCEPGSPVPVGDGWRLGLGEYSVSIVRRGTER